MLVAFFVIRTLLMVGHRRSQHSPSARSRALQVHESEESNARLCPRAIAFFPCLASGLVNGPNNILIILA
jgi:hypothetical protein